MMTASARLPFSSRSLRLAGWATLFACTLAATGLRAQVTLVATGQPESVIMTSPTRTVIVLRAAQELQKHLQLMSGALVPISTVGQEANYPGKKFIYVGSSAATTAAGISLPPTTEHYTIRTVGSNLYIVGRDGGNTDWTDLSGCQPGNMFGVFHLLGEVLGVRWLWPGDDGIVAPQTPTITVPAINVTTGPAMEQRKYRNPRVGFYKGTTSTYGFGVPGLPESAARRVELANEELLWQRRQRMGTRRNFTFAHSFTTWWDSYGATNPEYFAVLHSGTQPKPTSDRVKLDISNPVVWDKIIDIWNEKGRSSNLNISPNDSRNHCVCSNCLAWDRPSQSASIVNSDSSALLGDRHARFYTAVANRLKERFPTSNVVIHGTAYDVFRNAPLEATVPSNVALAYVPGPPNDTTLSGIAETEEHVLGWIAKGCTKMYLRPNWMLSAHAGPFWPTYRLGNHFKKMLAGGYVLGLDSDSSCGSYSSFGLYYYLVARLMANPELTVDAIVDEYCSGFGTAADKAREYFSYWENFIYNHADSGNTSILGWSSGMPAYPGAYKDSNFDAAMQILDAGIAQLGPTETAARDRFEFLRIACLHGKLTAKAISLVKTSVPLSGNPQAESAMRALLAYRDANAESFAIWREWMIDRESAVAGMQNYWSAIFASPHGSSTSNVGAFFDTNKVIVMEAESFNAKAAGTGVSVGASWQENTTTTGAVGVAMQALPNAGAGANETATSPRLDFKVDIPTAGTWYALVRMPNLAGSDNSVNVGLDGSILVKNLNNTAGRWAWPKATLPILTPGVHTLNVWMREDGTIIDRIILTDNPVYVAVDSGPPESEKRGDTEYLFIVEKGIGGGRYGAFSTVPIEADPAPANYVFDRWATYATEVLNPLATSTYATVPEGGGMVTAIYKLSAVADTDGDGILDSWEVARFGNLTTASATTDTDDDGLSDRDEYLAGTDPLDPASLFKVVSISPAGDGDDAFDVIVQWLAVTGKTYRILISTDLNSGVWTPIATGIPGQAPLTTYTLRSPTGHNFIRVQVE